MSITMPIVMYGIPNCDTVKKARVWLADHKLAYEFHDYKTSGLEAAKLNSWIKKVGWEVLLNKASTTFKALPDADKADLDEAKAIRLMLSQTSMIKRPVLESGTEITVGFKPPVYEALLAKA